jgi:predicted anti-sigma-YlaC factor YlaD
VLGNFSAGADDHHVMDCPSCRDILSARLDGEASEVESAGAEHHLATCAPCRSHFEQLSQLHRAVRVAATEPVPDLSPAIMASAPVLGGRDEAVDDGAVWRVGLALVALAQVLAALAHLGGTHLERDQASWEAALAAGFAWSAWRPARSAGLVPVTGVLTLLLLVNGGVVFAGAGTHHLLAPLGFVLLVLATRRVVGPMARPTLR